MGGSSAVDGSASFTGSFAGGGHTIANLFIDQPSRNFVGIWSRVINTNSVIENFVLDHAGIRGSTIVGSVVGRLENGMVSNVGVVSSQNRSVSGTHTIGGLVGATIVGKTVMGYVTGDVSGTITTVGGLVGQNEGTTVIGYATGTVSGILEQEAW